MLIGVTKNRIPSLRGKLPALLGDEVWEGSTRIETKNLLLCFDNGTAAFDDKKDRKFRIAGNKRSGLVWIGDIYNQDELGADKKALNEILWEMYQASGPDFARELNGDFVMVIWEEGGETLHLIRDKIGVHTVYTDHDDDGLLFSSSLRNAARLLNRFGDIDSAALMKYLTFCYNPGQDTLFRGIRQLGPGSWLRADKEGLSTHRYWTLSFSESAGRDETTVAEEIRVRLERAVQIRMSKSHKTGAFLSGGLDSSSVVSLLNKNGVTPDTFSFRCRGEGFDESPYASKVADAVGASLDLVEYDPENVLLAADMVKVMDEPFSDVGINIGTYLLAKTAAGKVTDLFTGDGGDELFAGHPVYVADNMAKLFAWIPDFILAPFFALGRLLPDSEKKKDWKVKIKRFSESYAFPKKLLTHRWRAYYQPKELARLLKTDGPVPTADLVFGDMFRYNEEADGFDTLSRSLHSDYQTVVQFYLKRMAMARSFGLNPRVPMLDADLSEYCASIPSHLKIKGMSDVKHIERIAVEPLLPHDVVHRKDKLGHSIPLKNWMRENEAVKNFVFDLLSEETVNQRGLFEYKVIEKMKEEHLSWKRNHSHRLWALAVLELWLRSFE